MEGYYHYTSTISNDRSVNYHKDLFIGLCKLYDCRDEENKIVEELFVNTKKPKEEKNEMFRAHPVPIESQIPLFDKIMADQERRSNYIKNKRRAELIANMQPFSFTRREEELQSLTRRLSKSSPCIFPDNTPRKVKQFKAKPVPKNLFSNYIYRKMNEDEFYR